MRSPYDGAVVGHMPIADADAVERSIERAQAAFEIMRHLPRFTRADILQRAADLIESRRDEFVRTIAAESGKPLYDARGEVSRGIFNLRNAAAEARRSHGEEVPLDVDAGVFEYQTTDASGSATELSRLDLDKLADMRRRVGIARRFPIGLILAISPFNFPLNLVLHKVAPAIAVGNAVVLKPAPQTPLTSLLLQEVMRDAGLPDGALEVCHCSIPLAESMVRDDRFAMVTFTGSAKVGWHIKSIAGHKKVALELGGNGTVIVAEDADLDLAAARCVRGGVVFGGQYCIGVQRILVHENVRAAVRGQAARESSCVQRRRPDGRGYRRGSGYRREVGYAHSGLDRRSADRRRASAGRWPACRRSRAADRAGGYPARNAGRGRGNLRPVLTLNSYRTFDEAVERANDSRYGLQGGLFTRDLQRAFRALEKWDVGGLMINDVPIYRIDNMPFGGWKESGTGREGTRYAMDEMSEIKLLVINYS